MIMTTMSLFVSHNKSMHWWPQSGTTRPPTIRRKGNATQCQANVASFARHVETNGEARQEFSTNERDLFWLPTGLQKILTQSGSRAELSVFFTASCSFGDGRCIRRQWRSVANPSLFNASQRQHRGFDLRQTWLPPEATDRGDH